MVQIQSAHELFMKTHTVVTHHHRCRIVIYTLVYYYIDLFIDLFVCFIISYLFFFFFLPATGGSDVCSDALWNP